MKTQLRKAKFLGILVRIGIKPMKGYYSSIQEYLVLRRQHKQREIDIMGIQVKHRKESS